MDPLPIPNIHFRFIKGYTTSKDLKVPKHLSCNFFGAAGDIWSYKYAFGWQGRENEDVCLTIPINKVGQILVIKIA